MGLVDTLKRRYDLRQVDKYTKRRMSQSQFESRDRDYYNSVYIDGYYLQEKDMNRHNSKDKQNHPFGLSSSSIHRLDRWSLPSFLRRPSQQQSLATQQTKTSESYTMTE
ncbi:uncharacterized protein BX664DRAFT_158939 [Halteromyces radiatus]|uniref:uncharacterized protein n=1 Tax=Halteromyces radiatus TaxID=101107 RepID=UPI00221EB830|nr:uncharacterized protein BX664DRAFT_158939 [Halteromyces radiatus]KAI8086502.1 hypothetical protein BX664DRAFT_158939 [Halteromyces radiatus]